MTSLSVFNNSIFRIAKHGYFRQKSTAAHFRLSGLDSLWQKPLQYQSKHTPQKSTKETLQRLKGLEKLFINPCLCLQQYLDIPLITKQDNYFEPSLESMQLARNMFLPRKDNIIQKVKQTITPKDFPDHSLPEVTFLGQSNAGKSTILKAIFESSPWLRIQTSSKPGCTKSLKFYSAGSHFCLVDLPGYGFRQPEYFQSSVMPYLKNRKNLVKTFLLIDIKQDITWDDAALQMLADFSVPFDVVMTKIDLASDSERLKTFLHLRNILEKDFQFYLPRIFMISSKTFEGLGYFQAYIAHITGNLSLRA